MLQKDLNWGTKSVREERNKRSFYDPVRTGDGICRRAGDPDHGACETRILFSDIGLDPRSKGIPDLFL